MNLNLSASLNIFKLISNPSLCLPHAVVPTFKDLPIPLDSAFQKQGAKIDIKAIVLDKDDCFAVPETNEVHDKYHVCQVLLNLKRSSRLTCALGPFQGSEGSVSGTSFTYCVQHRWCPQL